MKITTHISIERLNSFIENSSKSLYDISDLLGISSRSLFQLLNSKDTEDEKILFLKEKFNIISKVNTVEFKKEGYSKEFRLKMVNLYLKNKMSMKSFCSINNIPLSTFYKWVNKYV